MTFLETPWCRSLGDLVMLSTALLVHLLDQYFHCTVSTKKMACSGENAKLSNFTNGAGPKFVCSSSLKTTWHSERGLNRGSSCSCSNDPFWSLNFQL